MRRGTCPKCESTEVYAARHGLGPTDGPYVSVRPHLEPGFRGVVVPFHSTGLWDYACGRCGYVESYLLDEETLAFVRRSWLPVPPT